MEKHLQTETEDHWKYKSVRSDIQHLMKGGEIVEEIQRKDEENYVKAQKVFLKDINTTKTGEYLYTKKYKEKGDETL